MKNQHFLCAALSLFLGLSLHAQQLPNAGFEDWSGSTFDGNIQPKSWNASNVTQFGFKFNFAHQEAGHTGKYSMMVQDQEIGAAGITEVSPGYVSLGQPWVYIESLLKVSEATAGDAGSISWKYRPDTMMVWIKRTGSNVLREDFHILFYSWKGTAKGNSYKGKNGNCTSTTVTDEESDIRQSTNANECGTAVKAQQVAEAWYKEKKEYASWTLIKVPVCYMSNEVPEKCNVIFSASNYPNFRANSGLYAGNSLYIDDVQMVYSSKIEKLFVDGVRWNGFNPDTEAEQVYSLGEGATTVPDIYATRGSGSFTNSKGQTATFVGRRLSGSEIEIKKGGVGEVTTITVRAEDGSSATTYRIRFAKAASSNTKLAGLWLKNGANDSTAVQGFNPFASACEIELPYGTAVPPLISATPAEALQKVTIKQAASLTDKAVVTVTAADGVSKATYTVSFKVALLSDNSLKNILVNGAPLAGFTPSQTIYRVSLPLGTAKVPDVKAVSAYPDGAQTIVYKAPDNVDGGVFQIQVSSPGNATPRTYKLTFKLEASSYSRLAGISVGGKPVKDFDPEIFTYYCTLDTGATAIPAIVCDKGDAYQTVNITYGDVNGITLIMVKAASGAQSVYRLVFTTPLADEMRLDNIFIAGTPLQNFSPDQRLYEIQLPVGTKELPAITWQTKDRYQTVVLAEGGLNGTSRITVTAGDGKSVMVYQLQFSVMQATNTALDMIYLDGAPLPDFSPEKTSYQVTLPKGANQLPVVTFKQGDEYQKVTARKPAGLTGEYKLTVRADNGDTRTYVITFGITQSSNTALKSILLDNLLLEGFDPELTEYTVRLSSSRLPKVEAVASEESQKVSAPVIVGNVVTIRVTAENGDRRVYTLTFEFEKSTEANISMIYIDGTPLSGFSKDIFFYTVPLQTATCPAVTVDKEKEDLQVTITTPYAAGEAQIRVRAASGNENTYIVTFAAAADLSVQLDGILINGVPLADFSSDILAYTQPCGASLPEVTPITKDGQTATLVERGNVVTIYVNAGMSKSAYTVTFTRTASSDCSLAAILLDGIGIPDFDPAKTDYKVRLTAGSALPVVSWQLKEDGQTAVCGQSKENEVQIVVTAQDGVARAVYSVLFDVELYDDAELLDLQVEGKTLDFKPSVFNYDLPLESGVAMPALTVVPKIGQTTMTVDVSDSQRQVIVTAESGRTNIYNIRFARAISDNALLADILIDGMSLAGFEPAKYSYADTLERGAEVVPAVWPVGQHPNQVITTFFSAVNGTTRINVLSEDGTRSQDYYVSFPVRKSSNTALEIIDIENVQFDFRPNVTDYEIPLPFSATEVPSVVYEKAEDAQRIRYISRPLGQTTQIVVTAENGDTRTYNLAFLREQSSEPNRLQAIRILETDFELSLKNREQRIFDVRLPYGTRTMTVEYEKMFDAQTVFVASGGVKDTTFITVRSNRLGEADEVYKLVPVLSTGNPAVLTSITVNNEPLKGFSPYNYSYIVPVENKHIVRYDYEKNSGVEVNVLEQTEKHWQAEVTCGPVSSVYDLWFYYKNDTLPNTEFDRWENAKYKGVKPVGWNTLGHFTAGATISIVGTYTTGNEVVRDGSSAVKMTSSYNAFPLGGYVPAYITLGNINASFSVAAGSDFSVSGGITFRNSPDMLGVRFRQTEISNDKSRIVYQVNGSLSSQEYVYTNTKTQSAYTTVNLDLRDVNEAAGVPQSMNIILNSFESESGRNGLEASSATMYVDWARFSFNHTLDALAVDNIPAALTGTAFSVTLKDPEKIELPSLAFTGQVADQAQTVVWHDETVSGAYGVRRADIRNFAENGTNYTDYTLEVKRPLDTRNMLAGILIDGKSLVGFDPATTDYQVHLASSDTRFPDFAYVPQSSRQTVTAALEDSLMTIVVTPEYGEARTYTVRYLTDRSSSTDLAFISSVAAFEPEKREYLIVADVMPDLKFTKKMDGQTVDMNNGVFTVTAEDGTVGTYTVVLQHTARTTSGQMKSVELDNIRPADFSSDVYDYTGSKPSVASFVRTDIADSVVFVQKPKGLEWQLYGYDNAAAATYMHTYTLNYSSALSGNTDLQGIYVDGRLIDDFVVSETEYTLATDTAVSLSVKPLEASQSVSVSYADKAYTVLVKAENGDTKAYRLSLVPDLSDNALLASITLDGVQLPDFAPDKFSYSVLLPVAAFKTAEPLMPSLGYVTAHPSQKVKVELGKMGETTNIIVSAEDGLTTQIYEVLIEAEPSHNAMLTGIIVNGEPLERFEQGRHYYSVRSQTDHVTIDWTSDDAFQTYSLTNSGSEYTVNVTAQDRLSTEQYVVEVFFEAQPNDASLADIILNDSLTFDRFEHGINSKLEFDPNNNKYLINLRPGTKVMPTVSAKLKMAGQTVEMRYGDQVDSLFVTAKDGHTVNTYVVEFVVLKSSNTDLKMITIDNLALPGFTSADHFYQVVLPEGEHRSLEEFDIVPELVEPEMQTYDQPLINGRQVTIGVHAEDGSSSAYTLLFSYTLSDADTLAMINVGTAEEPLEGFEPHKFNYYVALPVGTQNFPVLTYDSIDRWQHITRRIVSETAEGQICQIEVQAESGLKNIYTVHFSKTRSSLNTLRMIYVDNRALANFSPDLIEYNDTLPAGSVSLPKIEPELFDKKYQTYDMDTLVDEVLANSKSLGQKIHINVYAEDNSSRTYILHFPIKLSDDTLLNMIFNNGQSLSGFYKDLHDYEISVPYDESGVRVIPAITVAKSEEAQNVDIVQDGDSLVLIHVMAEDALHSSDYTIRFSYGKSPVADLDSILLNGTLIKDFAPDSTEYFLRAYYADSLPVVEWIPAMEGQSLYIDEPVLTTSPDGIRTATWTCDVTAPDMEHFRSYTLTIEFSLTEADTMAVSSKLKALSVRGLPVSLANGFNCDFRPDTLNYTFRPYKRGSLNDVFFSPQDVEYQTEDPLARVDTLVSCKEIPTDTFRIINDSTVILRQVERTITLVVSDRNGLNPVQYALHQHIQLSHDSAVAMIMLDGKPFLDFDPDIHEYTYYIKDGATPPDVTFLVADSAAYAPDVIADEYTRDSAVIRTRTMVCMSEYAALYDNTNPDLKNSYVISFLVSPINDAQKPLENDVLIRHIPYSTQVMLASLRSGVQVGIYDQTGKIVFYRSLEASDPGNVITAQDAYGHEIFTDVKDVSRCVVVSLKPNQPYFYVFFEGGKKKIVSGKIIIKN